MPLCCGPWLARFWWSLLPPSLVIFGSTLELPPLCPRLLAFKEATCWLPDVLGFFFKVWSSVVAL